MFCTTWENKRHEIGVKMNKKRPKKPSVTILIVT